LQAQQGQKLQIYSSLQSEASQGIFFIFKRSDYFIAMFKTDRHNIFGGRSGGGGKRNISQTVVWQIFFIEFNFSFPQILLIFFKKKSWYEIVSC